MVFISKLKLNFGLHHVLHPRCKLERTELSTTSILEIIISFQYFYRHKPLSSSYRNEAARYLDIETSIYNIENKWLNEMKIAILKMQ